MDPKDNSNRLYNVYKDDIRRVDRRYLPPRSPSNQEDRKIAKSLLSAINSEIPSQLARYSNAEDSEFFKQLRFTLRSNEGTLVGYNTRISKNQFYLRPSLLNFQDGVMVEYSSLDKPNPKENTRVAFDVLNDKYIDASNKKKITIKPYFKGIDWRYVQRSNVSLPFKYQEFQESFWYSIDTDFTLDGLTDVKLFEDIYFSNIISSPSISAQGLGGIFTSFTYNAVGRNPVSKLLKKMHKIIPTFGKKIRHGSRNIKIETYTNRYESSVSRMETLAKQRLTSPNNSELNVNIGQSINTLRFKEADLNIPIISNFSINTKYNYGILSDIYEYLVCSLYIHPVFEWKPEDKIKITESVIEKAKDEILPNTRAQIGQLLNADMLSNQITRVALNLSRKQGKDSCDIKSLERAKNTIINNYLELANHVRLDTVVHRDFSINVAKPIDRQIILEIQNMLDMDKIAEKSKLLSNLVKDSNKSLFAFEMALDDLAYRGVLSEIRDQGTTFIILIQDN